MTFMITKRAVSSSKDKVKKVIVKTTGNKTVGKV